MFSREFGGPKGAKSKYIFKSEGRKTGRDVVACLPFGVSTGGRWSGSLGVHDLPEVGSGPLVVCSAFRPLSCFVLGALRLKHAFIRVLRAFLAGFPCWMWVCITWVLCVACGAFVCVSG